MQNSYCQMKRDEKKVATNLYYKYRLVAIFLRLLEGCDICMYIKRALEDVIEKTNKGFKAVLVTGARQVGKSTLLKHLM